MSIELTNKWQLVVEDDSNVQLAILGKRTFAKKTRLTEDDQGLAKKTRLTEDDQVLGKKGGPPCNFCQKSLLEIKPIHSLGKTINDHLNVRELGYLYYCETCKADLRVSSKIGITDE